LIATCPDRVGIVAAASSFIARHGGWIVAASQHTDAAAGWFFMRYELLANSLHCPVEQFQADFEAVAAEFSMEWRLTDSAVPKRVVLLVSREDHCLADLLYRWRSRELFCDVAGVISNHDVLRNFVEWHDIPYHYVPIPRDGKAAAFARIAGLLREFRADVVVLARFMQILPQDLCREYGGRLINIHHSFLPSFVGAKPYHQAYLHGVKLIGATCHYVTAELDAGPIIEQDVIRVNHQHRIDDLIRLGRDVEKAVLARGLRYHLEDRVLIHGSRTVVFA
jgi:formyltetrahydrofolate deformylase